MQENRILDENQFNDYEINNILNSQIELNKMLRTCVKKGNVRLSSGMRSKVKDILQQSEINSNQDPSLSSKRVMKSNFDVEE